MKNMLKNKHIKFEDLYESYYSRYTAGCFTIGDVVTFEKGFDKEESFKSIPPDLKEKIKEMADASTSGEAVVCVQDVSLQPFVKDAPTAATMTLAYSLGGGRYIDPITIPGSLGAYLKRVENGNSLVSTIPAKNKVDYTTDEYYSIGQLDDNKIKAAMSNGYIKTDVN